MNRRCGLNDSENWSFIAGCLHTMEIEKELNQWRPLGQYSVDNVQQNAWQQTKLS